MQKQIFNEFTINSPESYHYKLANGLDTFEREYELRGVTMPAYMSDNIATLRNIIATVINEEVLNDRFRRELKSMGTWQEFFGIFGFDNLAIKYYMNIVLDSISKDIKIRDLQIQLSNMEVQLVQRENMYNQSIIDQTHSSNKIIEGIKKDMNAQNMALQDSLEKSNNEILVLKAEIRSIYERGLQEATNKVAILEEKNKEMVRNMGALQDILMRDRKQKLQLDYKTSSVIEMTSESKV